MSVCFVKLLLEKNKLYIFFILIFITVGKQTITDGLSFTNDI